MLTKALEERAKQLIEQGERLAVATVVRVESPTSSKPGARALISSGGEIHGWIGGGCAQPAVIRAAQRVLSAGTPELVRVTPEAEKVIEIGLTAHKSSCKSGGVLDIFIEPLVKRHSLLVLGSSPCALALAEFAAKLEFEVTLAANGELPGIPGVYLHEGYDLSQLHFSGRPYVVVATQGRGDKAALTAASRLDVEFIGFIASAKKAEALRSELLGVAGVGPALADMIAPFGSAINVKTPEEIAIAALSQLIERRNSSLDSTKSARSSERRTSSSGDASSQETSSANTGSSNESKDSSPGHSPTESVQLSALATAGAPSKSCCGG